jgi:RNA polymerase sigma-70 factor (ECF subfamily)
LGSTLSNRSGRCDRSPPSRDTSSLNRARGGGLSERVARQSYRRLVARLSQRSHDLTAAEDALAGAFRIALEVWPKRGLPERPEAWLLTTARRRLPDGAKHRRVAAAAVPAMLALTDEAIETADNEPAFPDERLKLLFGLCASGDRCCDHTR